MNKPNRRGLIIDFNSVAAMLADEDATIQAEFFNIFAKELNAICPSRHAAEMQACWIAKSLTPEAKEIAKTFSYEP